jgi:molybdopterin converting factor small subunit
MGIWRVKMFAYLKDRHGEEIQVQSEPSSSALLKALAQAGVDVSPCRLAVNHTFVQKERSLAEGDELALIPPVSGG